MIFDGHNARAVSEFVGSVAYSIQLNGSLNVYGNGEPWLSANIKIGEDATAAKEKFDKIKREWNEPR